MRIQLSSGTTTDVATVLGGTSFLGKAIKNQLYSDQSMRSGESDVSQEDLDHRRLSMDIS